jgi:hypothetical protein
VTLNGINILANWRVAKHQPRKPQPLIRLRQFSGLPSLPGSPLKREIRRADERSVIRHLPHPSSFLTSAGVEARYFELDSDLGHSSSGPEHAKWSPVLREFPAPLVAQLN